MRLVTRIVVGACVVGVTVGAVWTARRARAPVDQRPPWTPLPKPVAVEVLNSGGVAGAARAATERLRHAGLDVVGSGNAVGDLSGREHNQVLVRRGDTTGVGRVIEVLGRADIIDASEPTHLVDLTVLLGRDFAPPPDRIKPTP